MANLTEPDEILMNFLRSTVTEVTRTGVSNRQTNTVETFNGDTTTKIFTLTVAPVCINSVSVGGTTQVAYLDYQIDLDNKKITFTSAPGTGTGNISVDTDTGSNWVYTDFPRDDLKKASYPRIGITVINESGEQQGIGATGTYDNISFQLDIVAYKDQACTNAGSDKIQGMDVAQLIARRVRTAIKNNWDSELLNYSLFYPVYQNNIPLPFDESNNLFRRIVTVSFDALNIGE